MAFKKNEKENIEGDIFDDNWVYYLIGIIIVQLTIIAGVILAVVIA